jgi:D-glycerate 3-kinase
VAAEFPDNRFLQGRGTAGTHDMKLGEETIENMVLNEKVIEIPRYDKSAFGGKGDRAERKDWYQMQGPLDLVIVEGWMLGFSPVDPTNKDIENNPGMD